jgi:catechol 2,3-dioxygenase-like lactoylglutathione lyase family enzyme
VFDHVTIRVSDREASERFYDTVLRSVRVRNRTWDEHFTEWGDFSIAVATAEKPVTRGLHIAFSAPSRAHVEEFWRTGVEAGYHDEGSPGFRPQYRDDYYGAFLRDPDGNSIEAVDHGVARPAGEIDHMWIRVADVDASQRFYEEVGGHAGFEFRRRVDDPLRAQFSGGNGSFSVVAGEPTRELHMAFPTSSNEAVDAFHTALTAAGYRDNGPPGERSIYHPGYYGAFVLDPDGNNIELVNHNR